MKTLKRTLALTCLCMLFTVQQSCKKVDKVIDSVDNAVAVLDEGIEKITLESQSWQNTLDEVLAQLPETVHNTKEEVSQLLNESIGAASSNVICVIDAIPSRVIRGLEIAKARLLGQALPVVVPTVCQTGLSVIDLNLPEIARRKIVINGYDFQNGDLLQLQLRKNDGTTTPLANRLSKQSNYQYTINIADMDATLASYDFLVLLFEDKLISEFSIIKVIEPEPEIFTLSFIPSIPAKLCPSHIGGDREFDGNGPRVQTNAQIFIVNQKEIHVRVFLNAKETQSDWTEAEGEWTYKIFPTLVAPAPSNTYKITRILSSASSSASYTDNDHSVDIPSVSGGLVSRFECIGDTGGNDVGNCNGNDDVNVTVIFNQVRIEIED